MRKGFLQFAGLVILMLLTFFGPQAHSQLRPYVKVGIDLAGPLGYRPGAQFGIGAEIQARRALFLNEASFSTANKLDTGDGSTIRLSTGAYVRAFGNLSLGGGARHSRLTTSLYTKSSTRPYVGLICHWPRADVRADFIFPGSDQVNRLRGVRGETVLRLTSQFDAVHELGVYRFTPSFGNHFMTGVQTGFGLRFNWRKL